MVNGNYKELVTSLRKDLKFQLGTIDELDWDYFLETAIKAKVLADNGGINMPSCERTIDDIVKDAISATEE